MEPTIIREEVQAFTQACQSFTGFVLSNRLTPAERETIANVVHTLGSDFKPSPDDPPLATTLSNLPLID
jgi:hypothetical protein